jgi:hypothetical protein
MLRLGVQDCGLRAKIRCGLHRISTFDLRLLNCNAVVPMATAEA